MSSGIPVLQLAVSDFPAKLVEGARLLVAFAVDANGDDNGDDITLHWRLYRRAHGAICELDPRTGKNTPLQQKEFDALFRGGHELPTAIGVAVSLSRRPGVPSTGRESRAATA